MSVEAYRLANWDTPLWINPNRRPSRFAADGQVVQYWSLHPLTPWAEILRFHNVTDPREAAELRLRPWVAQVHLPEGTIEVDFDNAPRFGISPDALVDEDHSRCQKWAASLSVPAMIVPSAALPGTKNLILFGPRVRVRYGVDPLEVGRMFRVIRSRTCRSSSRTFWPTSAGAAHPTRATTRGQLENHP